MKISTLTLLLVTTMTQCGCMEDTQLPGYEDPNDSASTGARIALSTTTATIPAGTEVLEVNGECIDVFGNHSIEVSISPGGSLGTFPNPCNDISFSIEIDLTAVTLSSGSAVLTLNLMTGTTKVDTEKVSLTIDAGTGLTCPGGGTHQYQGKAPQSIRDKARQAAEAVNTQYSGLINQACPAKRGSGNNDFLYRVVQRLRQDPTDGFRWGLNGKRGAAGDMSEDVVDYYWGPGNAPEGKLETYLFDVIVACEGAAPTPAATDVTLPDVCGRWILPASYPY
ncbi:MAG: hypothetical protein ABL958_18815 [Bdellovibrionia bacterium]